MSGINICYKNSNIAVIFVKNSSIFELFTNKQEFSVKRNVKEVIIDFLTVALNLFLLV